jgi:hypothetical protein
MTSGGRYETSYPASSPAEIGINLQSISAEIVVADSGDLQRPPPIISIRAIRTDQFVDSQLVQCLTLLGVRDPSEFAKFLAIAAPQQSYLAARLHAEALEPRQAVNPGE